MERIKSLCNFSISVIVPITKFFEMFEKAREATASLLSMNMPGHNFLCYLFLQYFQTTIVDDKLNAKLTEYYQSKIQEKKDAFIDQEIAKAICLLADDDFKDIRWSKRGRVINDWLLNLQKKRLHDRIDLPVLQNK